MFYNIKTKDVRANGRGRGRVGTPYYIIRARMRDGVDGVNGIDGDGAPRGESRSGDFYRTGDFTGRGKQGYKGGERGLQGRGKGVT